MCGAGAQGPGENDVELLTDGRLLAVFRVQSCASYWSASSRDGGATWSAPSALPFGSVRPKLLRLADGRVLLAGGRPGLFLWVSSDAHATRWAPLRVAELHNRLLARAHPPRPPDPELLFPAEFVRAGGSCTPWNSSAASEAFIQGSSAYTSLLYLGGGRYVLQYDRLANGWSPPMWRGRPGVWGSRDSVFAMSFTLVARK